MPEAAPWRQQGSSIVGNAKWQSAGEGVGHAEQKGHQLRWQERRRSGSRFTLRSLRKLWVGARRR